MTLPEPIANQRDHQIAHDRVIGLRFDRKRGTEGKMMRRRTERQSGGDDDRTGVTRPNCRRATDMFDREGVGAGSQMWSVLLGRADRQHRQTLRRKPGQCRSVELVEEQRSFGHHARHHNAPARGARAVCLPV